MRRLILIIFLFTLVHQTHASENEEFRATWVITWEHISAGLTAEQNKARVRKILDDHAKANMNAVLWQVRQGGTAYYNSSYEPWGYYAGHQNPGYDPLAYAIEEAHKRGMELHAWFNVFHTSDTHPGTPVAEHPEWVCRDRDGNPMTASRAVSPGLAEVREYTTDVAMEIVRNYDIDGLHLDYVRWNEFSNSAESRSLAKKAEQRPMLDGMIMQELAEDAGENFAGRYLYDVEHPYSAGIPDSVDGGQFPSWEDWWRWSVTEFVRTLHDSIQAVKPWVRLSPAALGRYNWGPWQGYGDVYQDAALWFNEGYIDQLTPMHYHWYTGASFYSMLEGGCPSCWSEFIQPGIAAGRLFTVGPYSSHLSTNNIWSRHVGIINSARTAEWTDGFQFFSYGAWEDNNYWQEASETFFDRKTKIRATGLIDGESPEAPTVELEKLDVLNYKITVTPPASISENQWFAIYRSEDGTVLVDEDNILHIHFGSESYTFTDSISGLQDFNDQYRYAATTLDRYWNESVISNVTESDPIPSFAPVVLATVPLQGNIYPISDPVVVEFSKTMDTTSVENAITFSPDIEIASMEWTDGNKTLVITPAVKFDYDTEYTVTISATAADINGTALDGNGDGTAGDDFLFSFTTKEVDQAGPVVLFSYPQFAASIDTFDVEEVITVMFDELIDEETVEDTTFILRLGSETVESQFLISAMDGYSIASMKSYGPLAPATSYSLIVHNTIADTFGNVMPDDVEIGFNTAGEIYTEKELIDNFTLITNWKQPDYSGSTAGIISSGTQFGSSRDVYLPGTATAPVHKRAAFLRYEWSQDEPPQGYLLREYLSGGDPRAVEFDTTYILQCYVFGDNSKNKFRIAIDEAHGASWTDHEVSKWVTIDWYGWRLIEWDLGDPNSVGDWISPNNLLDGTKYRIDSFQLTRSENSTITGMIYLDNLQIVKKSTDYIGVEDDEKPVIAESFKLHQNYPNPFNPVTKIPFEISKDSHVSLSIYNMLGRRVATLVDRNLSAGYHEVLLDASRMASGIYIYRLDVEGKTIKKRMMLLK